MNATRLALSGILVTAAVAGVAMYYLQVYGFYEEASGDAAAPILLTLPDGTTETLPTQDLRTIERDSSPISFRACFTTAEPLDTLAARAQPYDDATPRTGPGWFDCFDAAAIGAALESGEARAFLSVKDIRYGIDRIVAVFPDGRGYAWQDINPCGEVVFDGNPPPEGCPPVPERAD